MSCQTIAVQFNLVCLQHVPKLDHGGTPYFIAMVVLVMIHDLTYNTSTITIQDHIVSAVLILLAAS